ncbi:hypothetical protein GCM10010260_78610 [Streptomyces filipinensis]|uniref:Photolyase/cryptochrome alpha/beta domain-containing protein n=1 Tax=Streptomyces filipinensis TaxID=66887 RepID=A0A918IJK2_9ACTN|nr:hypothetical protein GCM10010260_78610 [Streptomyces filipinensis]
MRVSVVLFISDLRLHGHPPLRAALAAVDTVVPLFVRDRAVAAAGFATPKRSAFLTPGGGGAPARDAPVVMIEARSVLRPPPLPPGQGPPGALRDASPGRRTRRPGPLRPRRDVPGGPERGER